VSPNQVFGNAEIRIVERVVLVGGVPAAVGARAFDVLKVLVENRNRAVGSKELLEAAWPGLVVEQNNVHVQIWALRKILGPQAIINVPGVGYQFCMAQTALAEPAASLPGRRGKLKFFIAVAAAVIAAAGVGVWWQATRTATGSSAEGELAQQEANPDPLSIAVLPFANLTGDPAQAYLADGLTAGLTTELARIRGAFIVSVPSARADRDRWTTARQIGRELGARFLLNGSVQRRGGAIRVDAQLTDAASNAQLWAEHFDSGESGFMAFGDRVTTLIGNSVGRQMVVAAARASELRNGDPRAVDLMLRASVLNLKPFSLDRLSETESLYRRVVEMEPNHTGAMAGLANSLVLQADHYGYVMDGATRENKYAEGRDIAMKAKQLDPDNPGVYVALMVHAISHDDYAGAKSAAETRLALEPNNPVAYNNLALMFLKGGEPQKAIDLETRGMALDPKNPRDGFFLTLGRAYFMLGDNDAAIEWSLKSLEKNPAYPQAYASLAMAYAAKQDADKARAAVAELHRIDPQFKLSASQKPGSSTPAQYRQYWEKKFLPAWRKAGLPE
jgi:TolB-like protein/DNA-binding winged helix-turn-helix (wHTH) protein/tetratricopeptide (TPR) repeat protein